MSNDPTNTDDAEPVRSPNSNPLKQYALNGQSAALKERAGETKYVLPGIAASGQITLINGPANSGKTLVTVSLLHPGSEQRERDGDVVCYINADDTLEGLSTKVGIAEQLNFQMLADGQNGFKSSMLLSSIENVMKAGAARQTTIILDTGKKFINVMDKSASREFMSALRRFALKGGTVVVLAHVNKRPGPNGELIEEGVGDFRNDADCQYLVQPVLETPDGERVVRFQQTKSRGYGERDVYFAYPVASDLPYEAKVASFRRLEDAEVQQLLRCSAFNEDETLIEAIESELQNGSRLKMDLLKAVMKAAFASRREVERVLYRYTGQDPLQHRWNFAVKDRGGKHYSLNGDGLEY